MNEILDTGKCVVCCAAGIGAALVVSIVGLAVVLNVVRVVLF